MKVRQRKFHICMSQLVAMYLRNFETCSVPKTQHTIIDAGGTTLGDPRRMNIDWEGLMQRQAVRSLVEPEPVDVVVDTSGSMGTYTVARKKDGVIVGTYTTEDEAQAVIDKAKAAKKATLVLV